MKPPPISPWDEWNQALVSQVHPDPWEPPKPLACYNLVVLGGGTAGLVTAAGAAGLGAKVALVERHLLGGDCLNVGCVPSKALLHSARAVHDARHASAFGAPPQTESPAPSDFPAIMERLRKLRARISDHDSAKRFAQLGVDVFFGSGRFSGPDAVEVSGHTLRFHRAVIATGARATVPDLPGLSEAGFLTNETVFNLTQLPRRLAVIGGGPIGCELAQAFQRLGAQVTLIHKNAHLLDREDRDAAEIVQDRFQREGLDLLLGARLLRVEKSGATKTAFCESASGPRSLEVDEILVAAGRTCNVEGLDLAKVGVEHDPRHGVQVDDFLRTSNPRIYAAGDICLRWKFTHAADAAARIVIQNALFLGRKKASALRMPWCTYTDPEIAHVGLSERDAQKAGIAIDTYQRPFAEVDRAIVDGEEEGFVKIHVRQGSDRILGATIVARHAGEMISEVSVAMAAGLGLGSLASVIHPYPTQAEAIRQCGDLYNRTRLTPTVKRLMERWLRWRRE